ncbi:hypothetical protein N7492_008111 [Penicillium capsulatum]|uniref:Uncharacterized protein n=1 Tax=Penicillium capsulatum TaxID=69766 RepID=A0A9W9LGL3_9EURO|nr:hypothetical protein N7492_008111 [Penicillium capsulatum]KAJ6105521.1 hypothetical protein N7512_009038 [Penicillium capsulatum]
MKEEPEKVWQKVVFEITAVVDAYNGSADGGLDLGFGRARAPGGELTMSIAIVANIVALGFFLIERLWPQQ